MIERDAVPTRQGPPATGADALARAARLPALRYMGSKRRLLPWIASVLKGLDFDSALDAFSGSGAVAYLLKCMGKRVVANDFLSFCHHIGLATVENPGERLSDSQLECLLAPSAKSDDFVRRTFEGIFFTSDDLDFLDSASANLRELDSPYARSLALAALARACVKRQPRGVFTVAGDPDRYKDGRRDLRLPLKTLFEESAAAYGEAVFDNGHANRALRGDALEIQPGPVDLVYLDPPYVPRADDNCYIKRYHFLEGLASYWRDPDAEIDPSSKVRKLAKRYTPFSYRRTAEEAFETLFRRYAASTLVLSTSSNGFPDLYRLVALMKRVKCKVDVVAKGHRYHFGTHSGVAAERATVDEYLLVGRD